MQLRNLTFLTSQMRVSLQSLLLYNDNLAKKPVTTTTGTLLMMLTRTKMQSTSTLVENNTFTHIQ